MLSKTFGNTRLVMNQYYPLKGTTEGEPSNRFVRATGTELDGRELLLGQLVYVRKDPLESHQAIQKPQFQPKQTRNLMKSFFKQMQIEENIEECINHQVLIPSLNMHVMKTQQLVKFVMKSVLKASGYISRNVINLQDEGQISQLITQADDRKSADAWVSLPCTDFTPWQHMNAHRHGWVFNRSWKREESRLGKCSLKQRGL